MPGKWKQALEGTRKLILMYYLTDLKKKPNQKTPKETNKSSSPKSMNRPDEIFYC